MNNRFLRKIFPVLMSIAILTLIVCIEAFVRKHEQNAYKLKNLEHCKIQANIYLYVFADKNNPKIVSSGNLSLKGSVKERKLQINGIDFEHDKTTKQEIISIPYQYSGIEKEGITNPPFVLRNILCNKDNVACFMNIANVQNEWNFIWMKFDTKQNTLHFANKKLLLSNDFIEQHFTDINSNGTWILGNSGCVIDTINEKILTQFMLNENYQLSNFLKNTPVDNGTLRDFQLVKGAKFYNDNEVILEGYIRDNVKSNKNYYDNYLIKLGYSGEGKIICSGLNNLISTKSYKNISPIATSPDKQKVAFQALYLDIKNQKVSLWLSWYCQYFCVNSGRSFLSFFPSD